MRAAISLVVFDLDGTLVDSLRDLAEALNDLLGERGLPPHRLDAVGRMVGEGAATLVRRGFDAAGQPAPPDALPRFLELYEARLLRFTRPYPGVPEMLHALGRRVPLAVLTNKPRRATLEILDALDLARHFGEQVIGGDEPLPRKPDPAGLLHLSARAAAAPGATLLVGDSYVDFQTARAAAARICMARYGFGFATFPADELRPSDLVIDTAEGLLDVL